VYGCDFVCVESWKRRNYANGSTWHAGCFRLVRLLLFPLESFTCANKKRGASVDVLGLHACHFENLSAVQCCGIVVRLVESDVVAHVCHAVIELVERLAHFFFFFHSKSSARVFAIPVLLGKASFSVRAESIIRVVVGVLTAVFLVVVIALSASSRSRSSLDTYKVSAAPRVTSLVLVRDSKSLLLLLNVLQCAFNLVCSVVSAISVRKSVSRDAFVGLVRMVVVTGIMFVFVLFQVGNQLKYGWHQAEKVFQMVVFFLWSRFVVGEHYFVPDYLRYGLDGVFAHMVVSTCLLILLVMASRRFTRNPSLSHASTNLDESLLESESSSNSRESGRVPKIYEI
jgi:preprotein translocase subunit SecG